MSVCPSVYKEQLGCHWTDLHEILYLCIFRGKKTVEKFQVSLKSDNNNGYFAWRHIFKSHSTHFFLELEMFQIKVMEKIRTHILCSIFLGGRGGESYRLWYNVEKYCKSGQTTDDSMVHASCMLDTSGNKHSLGICNNYCFSIVTMIYGRALMICCTRIACLFFFNILMVNQTLLQCQYKWICLR
jgi:hypothetical protein